MLHVTCYYTILDGNKVQDVYSKKDMGNKKWNDNMFV
jgi:hypothetical protein